MQREAPRAEPPLTPDPSRLTDVEAALGYLLSKSFDGWRMDEKVEGALLECEQLKWPAAPLWHLVVDFHEYWMVIQPANRRPCAPRGWRQAFRNWCRIERERTESREAPGVKRGAEVRLTPHASRRSPPQATEAEAKAAIAGMKERFGWAEEKHENMVAGESTAGGDRGDRPAHGGAQGESRGAQGEERTA